MLRRPLIIALIAVLLSIILVALMFFFLISPKNKEKDKVLADIQNTDTQINAEKAKNKTLIDIKNKSAEYEARLAAAQAMIPAQPELPALIRMLQAAADPGTGADIPWLSFTPGDVGGGAAGSAAAATSAGGYSQYTFGLSVAGFYDDITEFVYRIERFQRAVIVDSIQLTPTSAILTTAYDPNVGLVQAQISARTFTFASAPGAAGTTAKPTTPVPSSSPTSSPTSAPR
jgi:Tfp pilus assembly protein PilO